MKSTADDDWNRTVRQPIGCWVTSDELQQSWCTTGGLVLEKDNPSLRDGPGWHDVRNRCQGVDNSFARYVGSDHQPSHQTANHQGKTCSTKGDGQRMQERLVRHDLADFAAQHPDPVVKRQVSDFCSRNGAKIHFLH